MPTATQNTLNFENLARYQERLFLDKNADLTKKEEVEKYYQQLLMRVIHSSNELERWLLDRSELEAALDQAGSILYIRMTCQTDDASRAQSYRDFIENVVPAVKPLEDQVNKKFLTDLSMFPLDASRYAVYVKALKTDVGLFVQDNVPLQTQVDLLSQEYQTIGGAMMVEFQGKEQTLPQMGKFLLEPDRNLRESAWRAMTQRRLKEKDRLEEIFDKMLVLRHQIAHNAQFSNFCEYKFKALHRFDYTPKDCKKYHDTVEKLIVPIWAKILERRRKKMRLSSMRPWDTSVDSLGRPALKPFDRVEDLIKGCEEIFGKVHPQLGAQFHDMALKGLLDLASRKGKAPGGYQSSLNEARKPFIFMNAVGLDSDMRTLLHEGGHAFHSLACAHDPLVAYRHGPMEFNEVASMAMELLGDKYISTFYKSKEEARSRIEHLEDVVHILVWVAVIDSFQHWIYENPKHSRQQRREAWEKIEKRFGSGLIDWQGLEEEHAYLWHRQLHVFEVPFYYIEYGIAQLGALQVWLNAKKNWSGAVNDYRKGLSLGGSQPLPEIYKTAGIRFDFSENTIAPLMEAVFKDLEV